MMGRLDAEADVQQPQPLTEPTTPNTSHTTELPLPPRPEDLLSTSLVAALALTNDVVAVYQRVAPANGADDSFVVDAATPDFSPAFAAAGFVCSADDTPHHCTPTLAATLRDHSSTTLAPFQVGQPGDERWWSTHIAALGDDRVVVAWNDVSPSFLATQRDKRQLDVLTDIVNCEPDPIARYEVDGTIEFASDDFYALLGLDPTMADQRWYTAIHFEDRTSSIRAFRSSRGTANTSTTQFRLERGSGQAEVWIEARTRATLDSDANRWVYYTSLRNVTDRRERSKRLERAAHHDDLTGLHNRVGFLERLHDMVDDDPALNFSVIFIDLDGFKQVNDTHGHAAGDDILRTVAERLSAILRADDFAGRLGGDEFVAILVTAAADVGPIVQRLRSKIEEPIEVAGTQCAVGASIGIAHNDTSVSAAELLKRADQKMYADKRRRKNARAVEMARQLLRDE